jgi:hypothetical protein
MKKKVNKLLAPCDRLTLYNAGSKLTLYLLQLIKGDGLESSTVHILLENKLRINWQCIDEKEIKENEKFHSNPLKTSNSSVN